MVEPTSEFMPSTTSHISSHSFVRDNLLYEENVSTSPSNQFQIANSDSSQRNLSVCSDTQSQIMSGHLEELTQKQYEPRSSSIGSTQGIGLLALHATQSTSIHKAAAYGDLEELQNILQNHPSSVDSFINQQMDDGKTPFHLAAGNGHLDCVQLLLDKGAEFSIPCKNGQTPLHTAASEGQTSCLNFMIVYEMEKDKCPTATSHMQNYNSRTQTIVTMRDNFSQTPLHLAAVAGYPDVIEALLLAGASIRCQNTLGQTPLHCSVIHKNFNAMVSLLSFHHAGRHLGGGPQPHKTEIPDDYLKMVDKNGMTFYHHAASLDSTVFLVYIVRNCSIDLNFKSDQPTGPTVFEVASSACQRVINGLGYRDGIDCRLTVCNQSELNVEFCSNIGQLTVLPEHSWEDVGGMVVCCLENHLRFICMESESSSSFLEITAGDAINHIKIGNYVWQAGVAHENSPHETLLSEKLETIQIVLNTLLNGSMEALSYMMLIPSSSLQSYLRLIRQYKSVIFFGPPNCGKSYTASKLAMALQQIHMEEGLQSEVTKVVLAATTSKLNLIQVLLSKGGLMEENRNDNIHSQKRATVILLDGLSGENVQNLMGEILPYLEKRGPSNVFNISQSGSSIRVYIPTSAYFIGTMSGHSRSLSLELSLQQQLRWVQLKNETDSIQCQLMIFLRRSMANQVFSVEGISSFYDVAKKKCENENPLGSPALGSLGQYFLCLLNWIVGVWMNLNKCLIKLGYPHLTEGPCAYFECPTNPSKVNEVFRWLSFHWNHEIAPNIEKSIKDQAMGVVNFEAQKQVVNTALYVLLHRTVAVGCPLREEEKKEYLSTFRGSLCKGILLGENYMQNNAQNNQVNICDQICDELPAKKPVDQTSKIDNLNSSINTLQLKTITPDVAVGCISTLDPSKKKTTTVSSSEEKDASDIKEVEEPKLLGIERNNHDNFPKKQNMRAESKNNANNTKSLPGSPGNTAPRVIRVKTPTTTTVSTTQAKTKVTSITAKSMLARGSTLSSSMRAASSSSKMSSSINHLRTTSPANLGRVSSKSLSFNSKSFKKADL